MKNTLLKSLNLIFFSFIFSGCMKDNSISTDSLNPSQKHSISGITNPEGFVVEEALIEINDALMNPDPEEEAIDMDMGKFALAFTESICALDLENFYQTIEDLLDDDYFVSMDTLLDEFPDLAQEMESRFNVNGWDYDRLKETTYTMQGYEYKIGLRFANRHLMHDDSYRGEYPFFGIGTDIDEVIPNDDKIEFIPAYGSAYGDCHQYTPCFLGMGDYYDPDEWEDPSLSITKDFSIIVGATIGVLVIINHFISTSYDQIPYTESDYENLIGDTDFQDPNHCESGNQELWLTRGKIFARYGKARYSKWRLSYVTDLSGHNKRMGRLKNVHKNDIGQNWYYDLYELKGLDYDGKETEEIWGKVVVGATFEHDWYARRKGFRYTTSGMHGPLTYSVGFRAKKITDLYSVFIVDSRYVTNPTEYYTGYDWECIGDRSTFTRSSGEHDLEAR